MEALGQAVAAGDPAVERLAAGIAEARAGQAAAAVRLGERLSALERAAGDARAEGRAAEDAARAEAQAVAEQLIALRAAAAQTELFADRLALLEASLPRLSVAQSLMMQALERQAGAHAGGGRAGGGGGDGGRARPAGGLPRPAADRFAAPEVSRRFRLGGTGSATGADRISTAYGGSRRR